MFFEQEWFLRTVLKMQQHVCWAWCAPWQSLLRKTDVTIRNGNVCAIHTYAHTLTPIYHTHSHQQWVILMKQLWGYRRSESDLWQSSYRGLGERGGWAVMIVPGGPMPPELWNCNGPVQLSWFVLLMRTRGLGIGTHVSTGHWVQAALGEGLSSRCQGEGAFLLHWV